MATEPAPDTRRRRSGFALAVLAIVFCAVQAVLFFFPMQTSGLGVLAVPLLPIILAYWAVVGTISAAGVFISVQCFKSRRAVAIAPAAVLMAMSLAQIAVQLRLPQRYTAYREELRSPERLASEREKSRLESCEEGVRNEWSDFQSYFKEPRVVQWAEGETLIFPMDRRVPAPRLAPGTSYEKLAGVTVKVDFPQGYKIGIVCGGPYDESKWDRALVFVDGVPVQESELVKARRP